jgi:hypothetical protein
VDFSTVLLLHVTQVVTRPPAYFGAVSSLNAIEYYMTTFLDRGAENIQPSTLAEAYSLIGQRASSHFVHDAEPMLQQITVEVEILLISFFAADAYGMVYILLIMFLIAIISSTLPVTNIFKHTTPVKHPPQFPWKLTPGFVDHGDYQRRQTRLSITWR